MPDQSERIAYLLERYANSQTSVSEEAELFSLSGDGDNEAIIKDKLMQMLQQQEPSRNLNKGEWNEVVNQILNSENKTSKRTQKRQGWKWLAAAALIGIIATASILLVKHSSTQTIVATQTDSAHDALPVTGKVMLTLNDGSSIELDSAMNGIITKQGRTVISKTSKGNLAYSNTEPEKQVSYNTLSTPIGTQYNLELSDGSKVWLNAKSSITFPIAFVGNDRQVSITGEAYFEVAKDKTKPFIVTAKNTKVQVLGTHFNVNSYDDEAEIKTTLLEGSVEVSSGQNKTLLSPGQQAVANGNNQIKLVTDANTDQSVAWKEGNFYFKNDDMQEISRQLSRYYDVNIVLQPALPEHYTGIISTHNKLTSVLNMLDVAGGIHYTINGKEVRITEDNSRSK